LKKFCRTDEEEECIKHPGAQWCPIVVKPTPPPVPGVTPAPTAAPTPPPTHSCENSQPIPLLFVFGVPWNSDPRYKLDMSEVGTMSTLVDKCQFVQSKLYSSDSSLYKVDCHLDVLTQSSKNTAFEITKCASLVGDPKSEFKKFEKLVNEMNADDPFLLAYHTSALWLKYNVSWFLKRRYYALDLICR
jgi:hypothetical protein